MVINIGNKKDLITLDLRCKQIRYLHSIKQHGPIEFINLSNSDREGYEFLYNEDKKLFLETLQEDLKEFIGVDTNIADLIIL